MDGHSLGGWEREEASGCGRRLRTYQHNKSDHRCMDSLRGRVLFKDYSRERGGIKSNLSTSIAQWMTFNTGKVIMAMIKTYRGGSLLDITES